MVINTNTYAIASARNLTASQELLGKSLSRLSSGDKISNPSDDAAGLAVSEKMKAQQARIEAASDNVQNAISYIATTDGFLSNMANMLTRMSELTTLAQDVTKNSEDVSLYNQEFQALQQQMRETIGGSGYGVTSDPLGMFNGISLFGNGGSLSVTIGEGANQTMDISTVNLRDSSTDIYALLSTATGLGVSDTGAQAAVTAAIQEMATVRSQYGASQSRLEVAMDQLQVQSENIMSAISAIRDVDVAEESTSYAKYQVLVQSGTAMLAQANSLPQSTLQLLQ